LLSFVN